MLAGRIGAIVMARRRAKLGPRRRPSEEELDRLKKWDHRAIQDKDVKENSVTRLRFRKIPWPYWIIGFLFMLGGFFCLYLVQVYGQPKQQYDDDGEPLEMKQPNHWISYSIIIFMVVLGYLFVINGRVKTTIFDKRTGLISVAKHPLSYYLTCCRNTANSKLRTYYLQDVRSVRAAQRGINRGQVNTLHYKIIIEFHNQSPLSILETHSATRIRKHLLLIQKFLGLYKESTENTSTPNTNRASGTATQRGKREDSSLKIHDERETTIQRNVERQRSAGPSEYTQVDTSATKDD